MELNIFEFVLSHLQDECRIGHKHIAPTFVGCHFLMLAFFEFKQNFRIFAFNPASFMHGEHFETTFGVVLVFQTILNHFELKLANGSDNFAAIELAGK